MAKRFTDTNKWKDDWYLSLSHEQRTAWQYVNDHCSIAGIFKKGFVHMNYFCKTKFTEENFRTIFVQSKALVEIGDSYFMPSFIKEQYPAGLESQKPMVVAVVREIETSAFREIIWQSLKNHSGMIRVGEEGKRKEEKEGEKGKKILVLPHGSDSFHHAWIDLCQEKKWRNKSQRALEQSLKILAKYTETQAIEMINKAIAGGWQGLVEPKQNTLNNNVTGNSVYTKKPASSTEALQAMVNGTSGSAIGG